MSYNNIQPLSLADATDLASKVATDLKRIQRFYGEPIDLKIEHFEEEIRELLRFGYLKEVYYGFRRGNQFIAPTLYYKARNFSTSVDDDPGKVEPNSDVTDASFYSFLTYSDNWNQLSSTEKQAFKNSIEITRGYGNQPLIGGSLMSDLNYSNNQSGLGREIVK